MVKDSQDIFVKVEDKSEQYIYRASIVGQNKDVDMALLKMEGNEETFHFAAIAPEEEIASPGDDIVILGYPFGNRLHDDIMALNISFSRGYISSLQQKNGIKHALLDISAKAGNSGSPVIHVKTGNVIGILCGSILNQAGKLTEEINYMRPISYFWELFTE